MNILTAGIFAAAFTACSDEVENETKSFNDGSNTKSFELTSLEQYSYSVPVKVNIEGDWEIDFQFNNEHNKFCYALPNKGHGPAEIKLCMLDNWTEERNEGQMIIRDLSNSQNDQTYRLMQKCNRDNPEIMAISTRGNDDKGGEEKKSSMYSQGLRTKAVGYGYDATKIPGPGAVTLNPIIALELLEKAGNDAGAKTTGCESANTINTYAASSYEELFQNVTVAANGKVTKGGLTAEMKASYNTEQKSTNDVMFVYTTVDANITNAYLSGLTANNLRQYMTDNAKEAIDGVGAYATGDAGFSKLVRDYGTHLIMKSNLGGRLRYASTVNKSTTSSKETAKAYAKASYKNKIVDSNTSVDAEISKSYNKKTSVVKTVIKAFGGDATVASAVNNTEESVNEWLKSLGKFENLMCVGVGDEKDDLIPLYDLVDTSTDAGRKRREAMKQYFESGMAQVMAYDGTAEAQSGDVYHFSLNSAEFKKANGHEAVHSGSLVYEAWCNNKVVAMVCKEYMPQISNMGLVLTVYPVNDNKPDFMNGRFLGNDILPAHFITWTKNNNGKAIMKSDSENYEMETEIYVRGGRIFTYKPLSCKRILEAKVQGKYLTAPKAKSTCCVTFGLASEKKKWNSDHFNVSRVYLNPWLEGLSYDDNYKYPLVKYGTHIWTRENYNGNAPHGSEPQQRYGTKIEKGEIYFTYSSLDKAGFPAGWHAGRADDYKELTNVVFSDGRKDQVDARMKIGGSAGFELKYNGWYTYTHDYHDIFKHHNYYNYKRGGYGTQAEFLLPGKGHVCMRANSYNITPNDYDDFAMQIRLVMNN